MSSNRNRRGELRYLATKVPEITVMFWALKLLTTGMGEAMSDFLGSHSIPIAGFVGLFGTLLAIWLQLRQQRYRAPYYWFLAMMIAIFGTMTADAIHDGAQISYFVTTPVFALMTGAVFFFWYRSEGTLSIHSVNTRRRELFYWAAVYGTFALGTAAGDMTAVSMSLGFFESILVFGAIILVPLVGWARFGWNPIFSFWFAYIVTRPLGASIADWLSKPPSISGLGMGDGLVSLLALIAFVLMVSWKTITGHGVQAAELEPELEPQVA